MIPTTPEILERVSALEHQVADLSAALTSPAAQRKYADRCALRKILPAIAGRFGSSEFTVQEFMLHADLVATAGMNSKTLGNLFARCEGQDIGGYELNRIGVTHARCLWKLVRVVQSTQGPFH